MADNSQKKMIIGGPPEREVPIPRERLRRITRESDPRGGAPFLQMKELWQEIDFLKECLIELMKVKSNKFGYGKS